MFIQAKLRQCENTRLSKEKINLEDFIQKVDIKKDKNVTKSSLKIPHPSENYIFHK